MTHQLLARPRWDIRRQAGHPVTTNVVLDELILDPPAVAHIIKYALSAS